MAAVKALPRLGVLALLVLGFSSAPAVAATDATTLLRESLDAPKSVSYIGQLETVRFSSNRAVATIAKVEHRAPTSTRRWFVAPEALYGDYIIDRGGSTYQFDTKHSKVIVSRNATPENAVTSSGNIDRVLANYRAVIEGSETVAEHATISIVLLNKYTGERALRVWLDKETHLVLKKEEYHGNGSVASQTRFDALRYTAEIPEGIFSTDVPSGYTQIPGQDVATMDNDIERVIAQAGFKPFEPQILPQGFTKISGDVRDVKGVKTLHLLYSDGLRSISLFENATGAAADFGALHPKTVGINGQQGQYVEDGPTTLLTWKERGLFFALVGDLMRNELVEIAKSVVP
ncbi:MAG: outer membrane lipoprotein-sorting protein [Vulcanimicrobiaceae bacterium]